MLCDVLRHQGANVLNVMQECFVLLRWNSLLLQQLRMPAAAKAAARLISSQAGLLDSLNDGGPPWSRVCAVATAVLRSKPILINDYLFVATSTGDRPPQKRGPRSQ